MAQPIASIIIPLIIILPLIVFWLWMARDMANNDNLPSSEKTYWMLAFLFMNVFAAVSITSLSIEKGSNHCFLIYRQPI